MSSRTSVSMHPLHDAEDLVVASIRLPSRSAVGGGRSTCGSTASVQRNQIMDGEELYERDAEDVAAFDFLREHPEPVRMHRPAESWQRRHLPGQRSQRRKEVARARQKRGWWTNHKAGSLRALKDQRHRGRRTPRPASSRRARGARIASSRGSPEPPEPSGRRAVGVEALVTAKVSP